MKTALLVIQTLTGITLIAVILIQSRGTGFARTTHASFTRRGLEKVVFKMTFVLALVFILVSILHLAV